MFGPAAAPMFPGRKGFYLLPKWRCACLAADPSSGDDRGRCGDPAAVEGVALMVPGVRVVGFLCGIRKSQNPALLRTGRRCTSLPGAAC